MKCVPGYRHERGSCSHPLYGVYRNMLYRCYNIGNTNYRWYGGRGIKVCERWRRSFAAFVEDVGARPEGMTLDREDRHGHYEPGNVRWAGKLVQAFNHGRTRPVNDISARQAALSLGMCPRVFATRLRRGWSLERASTEPVRVYGRKSNASLQLPLTASR